MMFGLAVLACVLWIVMKSVETAADKKPFMPDKTVKSMFTSPLSQIVVAAVVLGLAILLAVMKKDIFLPFLGGMPRFRHFEFI
jgi:hypothetical protein